MIDTKIFLKLPLNFKNKFYIYPPSVKEVIENDKFGIYQKIFTMSQEELEDEFTKSGKEFSSIPTPFEFLISSCYNDKNFLKVCQEAFYFFTKQDIVPLFQLGIFIVGNLEEVVLKTKKVEDIIQLGKDDYFEFQNEIRKSLGMPIVEPPNPNEHPKIREMKAKARYRDKIKAKQGNGLDLTTILASICCMEMGLNPLNIGDISYASANVLVGHYQLKEKYQLDIDSLLAGADSKKVKPKYWIQQLD